MKIMICLVLLLTGCAPTYNTKHIITDNHAISYVLAKRINGPDVTKPTKEEIEQYVKASAAAWEALDREVNGWSPAGGMETISVFQKEDKK